MDGKTKNIIRNLIFPLLFVGCILFVTAFFLPDWFRIVSASGNVYIYGLFQTCFQSTAGNLCTQTHLMTVDGDWVPAFQTFGSISLICYFVAASLSFLVLCWSKKKKRILCYASIACSCATSVSLLVMIIVFLSQHVNYEGSYQFAFYLAAASLFLVLLGSVLSILMIIKGFIEPERKLKNKHDGKTGLLISGLRMQRKQIFRPPLGTAFKDFGGRQSQIQTPQKAGIFDDMRENTTVITSPSGFSTNSVESTNIATPINSSLTTTHTLYNTPPSRLSSNSTGRTSITTHAYSNSTTTHTVLTERNEEDISIAIIDDSLEKDNFSTPEHGPNVSNNASSHNGKKNASKFSNCVDSSLELQIHTPVNRDSGFGDVNVEEIPTIELDNNLSKEYGQNSDNSLQDKEKKCDNSFKEVHDNDLIGKHMPPSKTDLYKKETSSLYLEPNENSTPVKNKHAQSASVGPSLSEPYGVKSDQHSKEIIMFSLDKERKGENSTEQCKNEEVKETSRKWKCVVTYISRNPIKMKFVNKNKTRKKSQPVLDLGKDRYSMYKSDQKQNSLTKID